MSGKNGKSNAQLTLTRSKSELSKKDLSRVTLRQNQVEYFSKIIENDITVCYGPAGTAKSYVGCYAALKMYLEKQVDEIILCKPIQESGEKLGFLPGNVDEKIAPFIESFRNNIDKIIGIQNREWLEAKEIIKYKPLAYMRGGTFDRSFMFLDEAQNADMRQLMLFTTRMGKESKIVIAGDISQYDISINKVKLPSFINMIKSVQGVSTHIFVENDIVRAKILRDIVKRYEKWKSDNNIKY